MSTLSPDDDQYADADGSGAQACAMITYDGSQSQFVTLAELSARERQVLGYLPSVLSAAEIGAELSVSANTVKLYLRSMYRKLGVSRRSDAVMQARRQGLLPAEVLTMRANRRPRR